MSTTSKKTLSKKGQILLRSLQKSVAQKKRLGQYAVVWQEGKPIVTGEDVPQNKPDKIN